MPRLQFLIATLLAAPLTLPAQATQQDCSEDALRRPQVEAFFARGDYEGAIAQLEQVQHRQDACRPNTLDANWYWLRSDLSLAYLKAGREQDCINLLGRLIDNPASSQDIQQHLEQDGRIHRALRTNQRLCHAAHEARLEVYRATPCPQSADGELASVAISPDRCLALLPATEAASCPRLEEWRNGKRQRRLSPHASDTSSPLADTARCCSIQTLRVAENDGQYRLRLLGEGRDCYGGSAYDLIDALYLLQGDELVPEQDFSRTR